MNHDLFDHNNRILLFVSLIAPALPLSKKENYLYKTALFKVYETFLRDEFPDNLQNVMDLVHYVKRNAYLGFVKRLNFDLIEVKTTLRM